MNICQNCNTQNDTNSRFCKSCGYELAKENIETVDKIDKVPMKSRLDTIIDKINENIKKTDVKQMFSKIKEMFKKSIFFRTKKHSVIIVILFLLILCIVVLWQSGIVFDKIADNVYNSYKTETITYEQAMEKLSKLDMFWDASPIHNDCESLKNSRDSYDRGISSLNAKDYKTAITEFENVIGIDNHYKDAQEKIKNCKLQLSSESYTMAVSYENSLDWFNAYDSYSYVIVDDANYTSAQAKMVELEKKIHDSTIKKLWEYKVSNDYESALELISKTKKYTSSDVLKEYNEYFNTQKKIADVVKFDYNHGPFTLYKRYTSGDVMYSMYIETFNIVDAEITHDGENIKIKCDITGVVSNWDSCSFDIKCYNEKGFITDSVNVFGSVASNEPFKITDEIFIPADTVRIEYVAD